MIIAIALPVAVLAATGAVGAAQGGDEPDDGVHGGPIERTHDPAACDLVDVSSLPGNWTHGDYVSAVEALGDPELVPIAARSACGKPAHAGAHPSTRENLTASPSLALSTDR